MKIFCDLVTGVALRDGVEIQFRAYSWNQRGHIPVKFIHPADSLETVHDCCRRQRIVREAESPGIIERPGSHIQRSAGLIIEPFRDGEYLPEHLIGNHRHAGVEAAQLRSFVVTGQGGVNQRQDGIHRLSYLAYAGLDAAVVEFH